MNPSRIFSVFVVTFGLALTAGIAGSRAQDDEADTDTIQSTEASSAPSRHFRMQQVVDLEPGEATRLYELVRGALAKGYVLSGFEGVDGYQGLRRFNTAPYLSSTHGNYYLNNYANDVASRYEKFEQAGRLPVGSIIYKDSFSIAKVHQDFSQTETRQIVLGPLFIMRKMEPGFNPLTGDWQYIQIQPDGEVLGMTRDVGAEHVDYCITCHLTREYYDHLYFVPDDYRRTE